MREPKELIKHRIQLPHDRQYQTALILLEKRMGILTSYDNISKGGSEMVPDQIW